MNSTNQNLNFDKVFERIGKGCRRNPDPKTLDVKSLAREFERVANELRVVPPDNIYAATGHQFTVEMLERACDITRGLANLPDVIKEIERLGRLKNEHRR